MKTTPITSAKQASKESKALKSVWSADSYLTQRILIYCAELLEQIVRKPRKRRPLTAWPKFVQDELKRGGTIRDAARNWRAKKLGKIA